MVLIIPLVVRLFLPDKQRNIRRTVGPDKTQIHGGGQHINITHHNWNKVSDFLVHVVAPVNGLILGDDEIHALVELDIKHLFHLRFL